MSALTRIAAAAALTLCAAPVFAEDCLSIGPGAEFCAGDAWVFDRYVEEGVLHLAAEGGLYHLHKLRKVVEDGAEAEVIFEHHAASFALEYGGAAFENVSSSQGEHFGRRSLTYAFSVKEWEEGNRTRLTFLIDGETGYSFVTSGTPPVDEAALDSQHEAALAAFRLKDTAE